MRCESVSIVWVCVLGWGRGEGNEQEMHHRFSGICMWMQPSLHISISCFPLHAKNGLVVGHLKFPMYQTLCKS